VAEPSIDLLEVLVTAASPIAAAVVTALLPALFRSPVARVQQDLDLALKRVELLEKALAAEAKAGDGPHASAAAGVVRRTLWEVDQPVRQSRIALQRYLAANRFLMALLPAVPSVTVPSEAGRKLSLMRRTLLLAFLLVSLSPATLDWLNVDSDLMPFIITYYCLLSANTHHFARQVAKSALEDLERLPGGEGRPVAEAQGHKGGKAV
jgi:hypothetical protein